ncbi:GHMP family kinase ATP-binding protein [Nocardia arizonensis]|uniref:GHMP family kinase ATP-binding protein n=1 Tax=Nocardia arizonensis TaxID=1141647 RepID=UPI0006D01726|nr:hypothetical protein [Nocardia arizonensis]
MNPPRKIGVGSAFGSCGELLQGVTADNRDFLVTLPIREGSVAVFESDPHSAHVRVSPPHKTKALALAEMMLETSPREHGGHLTIISELPEGKGLASSTADLVATARAVADSHGAATDAAEIEAHLRRIEPSDGVMYPGAVAFYHREVRLLSRLQPLPPMTIVLGDEGGQLDTVEFNRRDKPFSFADTREYSAMLAELTAAIGRGDLAMIGAIATRSAIKNSALRERPHLDMVTTAARRLGALGVVVAHSGTTTGILLADADPDRDRKLAQAREVCAGFAVSVSVHHTWRPGPPDWPVGSRQSLSGAGASA